LRKITILFCVLFLTGSFALAQEFGGIKGTVTDQDGNPLPGVTVTLTGSKTPPRTVITSERGNFRFLNLPVANDYTVTFELPGFKKLVREKQVVSYGRDVILEVTMEQATLEEQVTVIGQTPVIDTKRTQVGVNVTEEMIMSLPTARNPWVMLALAPGVLVDREDIGGSDAGQQSAYYGHGSSGADQTWNVDGANITDISALGAAPAYLNLASYEELQINYGNNDVRSQTGGVQLNFVSKRGGNTFSGSFYLDAEDKNWQSENIPDDLKKRGYKGAGINKVYLYGAGFGGPIIKDRAWFYGTWGIQDLGTTTLAGTTDNTWLQSGYARLDFQLSPNTRLNGFLEYDSKLKWGRTWFGATFQGPETVWNQHGPGYVWKGEVEQMFGNLFLNAKVISMDMSFYLVPTQGHRTSDGSGKYIWLSYYPTFYLSGNTWDYGTIRPTFNVNFNGNYFAEDILGADHEIKFGADYMTSTVTSYSYAEANLYIIEEAPDWRYAVVVRDFLLKEWFARYSFFVQDTLTLGKLTLGLGLRYDIEQSKVDKSKVPASPWLPQYMAAIELKERIDPGVKWKFLSPRLSLIYDIFGNGKDVIKLNLARYGSQSGYGIADFINPLGWASWTEIGLLWVDANGDNRVTANELFGYDWDTGEYKDPNDPNYWVWYSGFDPANPTKVEPRNKIDPDYNTPILDEISLGYEKELLTDFAARLGFFYKQRQRFAWDKGIMADGSIETAANWYKVGRDPLVNADYYGRRAIPVASYRTLAEKARERYMAGEIVLKKRLSHNWMLDGSFTLSKWTWHYNGDYNFNLNNYEYYDGGVIAPQSGGSGITNVYVNSRWMAKLAGLYQFPYGINASFTFVARDGYVVPYYTRVTGVPRVGTVTLYGRKDGSKTKFGDDRLPTFYVLNFRLEKSFHIFDSAMVVLAVDAFNALNNNHTLAVDNYLKSPDLGMTMRILNPRVFRFGIRFSF